MKKNNKNNSSDMVINVPTKLRYYLDSIAILITGIIITLAINYAFSLIG